MGNFVRHSRDSQRHLQLQPTVLSSVLEHESPSLPPSAGALALLTRCLSWPIITQSFPLKVLDAQLVFHPPTKDVQPRKHGADPRELSWNALCPIEPTQMDLDWVGLRGFGVFETNGPEKSHFYDERRTSAIRVNAMRMRNLLESESLLGSSHSRTSQFCLWPTCPFVRRCPAAVHRHLR